MIKVTLDTKAMKRLARGLARVQVKLGKVMDEIFAEIGNIETNHRNIVAAHKAHRTMAKQGKRVKRA